MQPYLGIYLAIKTGCRKPPNKICCTMSASFCTITDANSGEKESKVGHHQNVLKKKKKKIQKLVADTP